MPQGIPVLRSSLPAQTLEALRKYSRLVSTQLCLPSFRLNDSLLQGQPSQDPSERTAKMSQHPTWVWSIPGSS